MDTQQLLTLIWPLILVQLAFQAYALYDLVVKKQKKTKNLSVVLWVLIIVFGEVVGAALYFLIGRSED